MNVFNFNEEINIELENNTIILGKFKSFHKGHMKIIKKGVDLKKGGKLIAMIYPDENGFTSDVKNVILSQEKRIEILKRLGYDYVMLFKPNKENYSFEAIDFIKYLKEKLSVKNLVIGFDFNFGKQKLGDKDLLKKHFNLFVMDNVKYEKKIISTSWIIEELNKRNIELVNKLLGYKIFMTGKVVKGKGRGKKIGSPTANIERKKEDINFCKGIYITKTTLNNKEYNSLTSISSNPTFGNSDITYETWLYEKELSDFYDKEIIISFEKFLREPIKFDSVDLLKEQILKDKRKAKKYYELV